MVLLDKLSKRIVKLDNSLLSSAEITVVDSLYNIHDEYLDENRMVCVFEGQISLPGGLNELQMYKDIAAYQYTFLLSDDSDVKVVSSMGHTFICDTKAITLKLLQAAIYDDHSMSAQAEDTNSIKYANSLLKSLEAGDNWKLAKDYLKTLESLHTNELQLQQLEDNYDKLSQQMAIQQENEARWRDGYKKLFESVIQLNEKLAQYETIFTKDIYKKIDIRRYPDKPTIVYFKVYSEFIGINTFIETVVDTFRLQARKSVKVVQLFDSSGDRDVRMLPEYYHRLRGTYTSDDVVQNNYLCKVGDYSNLMDKLLLNKEGIDALIVIDNKNFDDVVFDGTFLQFNLCRTVTHARTFALAQDYTIINQKKDGWNSWVPVNLNSLSKQEQFIKLSSRPIIAIILKMSDKFANAF